MQEQAGSILSRFRPAVAVASVRLACGRIEAPALARYMASGRDSAREWIICALNRSPQRFRLTLILGREDVDACFRPCFPGFGLVRA